MVNRRAPQMVPAEEGQLKAGPRPLHTFVNPYMASLEVEGVG
jgi:hypothetical protein